jgi:hypothetical protein
VGARRRRRILIAAAVAAGVAAIAIVWFAWVASHVNSDLRDAENDAHALSDALSEGDAERAREVLADFQEHSGSAADSTDSLTWSLFEKVPFYGDDARAVAAVSEVLVSLGEDGIEPLLDSADEISARAYSPKRGQFPLADIAALEAPTVASYEAFHAASGELAAYDSEDFVAPLASSFNGLRDQIDSAEVALGTAARASRLMPAFLGADGERNYLYVFQNNAEVRSTGGLPGNISLVNANDGRVRIARQASGAQLGEFPEPVLPLTEEERAVYGNQLGTYFLDANFTPDFPRVSELWRARWQAEFDEDIDGVMTVDPVTLSYLLAATGPVTVQGVVLTSSNVVSVVESRVYLNVPDPLQQDEFLNRVAKTVFDTFANGAGDPVRVIQALFRGVEEGRVRIHSFSETDQEQVAGTEIAGELPVESDRHPHVGVYLNDATGSKMSYYLQYSVDVAAVSCDDDQQELRGRFEISSKTPDNPEELPETVTGYDAVRDPFIKRGQQFVVADIFVPIGGEIRNINVDGEVLDPFVMDRLEGRDIVSLAFLLTPRETHRVTWEMTSGPDQDGDTIVDVTPGVLPESESSTVPTAC